MKALIDTNVIVDVLQAREPWRAQGQEIFLAAANRRITACITAKEAADLYYFSRKQFSGRERVDEKARDVLAKLYALFDVLDTLAEDCRNALGISNGDYEDAMMIAAAVRCGADCIVTRNMAHFAASPVPVYSPGEFLAAISSPDEPASR